MKATILVKLKSDVVDAAGREVATQLSQMGFAGVLDARIGKVVEIEFDSGDREAAESMLEKIAKQVLINPTIEDYEIVSFE